MNIWENKIFKAFLFTIMAFLLNGCPSKQAPVESEKSKSVKKEPILTFTVSGYGKVFYEANMCDLVFGIETDSNNVIECQKRHEERVSRVTDYVKGNTPKDNIFGQVSYNLSIITHPIRERGSYSFEKVSYRFVTVFSMRMKSIDRLPIIQAELIQRGVNKIIDLELLSDKHRELVDEARKMAIEDAKLKARFLESQAGWELLGIRDIRFNEESYRKARAARGFGVRGSVSPDISSQAAETYVDSSMTVTFEYKRKGNKKL